MSRPTSGAWRLEIRVPAVEGGNRAPGPDRLVAPANLHGAEVLDLDPVERQPVGVRADQNLVRRRALLESRGEVDRLAGREGRVAVTDDDLARLDADPCLEAEVGGRLDDLERRADRTLGVVLVRLRDAERGHHCVARKLLDEPPVALDALRGLLEEPVDPAPDDLGIGRGDEPGRIDQVDEQHGRQLAFHSHKCRNAQGPRDFRAAELDRLRGISL